MLSPFVEKKKKKKKKKKIESYVLRVQFSCGKINGIWYPPGDWVRI